LTDRILRLGSEGQLQQARLNDGRVVYCTMPAEAHTLWREMSSQGFYRRAASRLRPGNAVLDVGANIGLASMSFVDMQPSAQVIAVEPVPELFACLEGNLARHVRTAMAIRAAVADVPGTRAFVYYPNAPGNSGFYANREADDQLTRIFLQNSGLKDSAIEIVLQDLHVGTPIEVEVVTVSDILSQSKVPGIALLKIDVERAELEVLRGIRNDDWTRISSVVAEVHDESGGLNAFRSTLHDHGFVTDVRQDSSLRGTSLYEVEAVKA
jgi:31-O-methyltransferase